MRLIIIDPGLRNELGHHANSCRAITRELIRRGIDHVVFGHVSLTRELQVELNANPLFRVHTYAQSDNDPFAGWLNVFDLASRVTADDLSRIVDINANDIVYLASTQPAQFLAVVRWFQRLPADARPHVVIDFGTDAGVSVTPTADGGGLVIRPNDYRIDPRAMFHRFAANQLQSADLPRFHLVTFDPTASAIFSHVIAKPVGVLPMPRSAHHPIVSRGGHKPVTVAVLGHQRQDKGYHLMPLIARLLLAHEPDIRLLIHNGAPDEMVRIQEELRAHAKVETRITLNEEAVGSEMWDSLLRSTDLMVCPYDPSRFRSSASGITTEAIANAIPVVVPAATCLADMLGRFGNPGTRFDTWTPDSIVTAIRATLADFDNFAERAVAAAHQFSATEGVGNMVNALLASCQAT